MSRVRLRCLLLAVTEAPAWLAAESASSPATEARQTLSGADAAGGFIIHAGCGDGRLTTSA